MRPNDTALEDIKPLRAAAAAKAKLLARPVSANSEPCRSCGDTLAGCPGQIRVFTRCCRQCTHLTQNDLDYLALHPGHLEAQYPERLEGRC